IHVGGSALSFFSRSGREEVRLFRGVSRPLPRGWKTPPRGPPRAPTRPAMSWTRIAKTLAALAVTAPLFAACAHSSDPDLSGGTPGTTPQDDGQSICLLHNCDSDAECASCSDGRNTCLVAQHRCVACDSATGTGCPDGEYCSSFGSCVPNGQTCTTDAH